MVFSRCFLMASCAVHIQGWANGVLQSQELRQYLPLGLSLSLPKAVCSWPCPAFWIYQNCASNSRSKCFRTESTCFIFFKYLLKPSLCLWKMNSVKVFCSNEQSLEKDLAIPVNCWAPFITWGLTICLTAFGTSLRSCRNQCVLNIRKSAPLSFA